jgi:hypothetical protein
MRTIAVAGALAVLALSGAAVAAAPAARTGCTPGPFSSKGSSGVVFCGPAKATAKVGRKLYTFSHGTCVKTSKYLYLNLGTEVLSGPKQKYSYFGLLVGAYPGAPSGTKPSPKDGTYTGGLVTIRWKGKTAFILNGAGDRNVKITLKNSRRAGTFSGTTFLAPKLKVTGSFTC